MLANPLPELMKYLRHSVKVLGQFLDDKAVVQVLG